MKPALKLAMLACCILAAMALSSQDIGLDSVTSAGFTFGDANAMSLSETIQPWFSLPLGKDGEFTGRGHIGLSMALDFAAPPALVRFPGDLDELKMAFSFGSPEEDLQSFGLTLGRFAFEDPSGMILYHPADGMALSFSYPALDLDFRAGYTGFILRNASTMILSKADLLRQAKTDGLVFADYFATPRLISQARLDLKKLGGHQVGLSFLMQTDLNPEEGMIAPGTKEFQPAGYGAVNTQYAILKGRGPLFLEGLSYDAWFAYGSGSSLGWVDEPTSSTGSIYDYVSILSFAGGATFSYAIPAFLDSSASLRVLAASGDPNATSIIEGATTRQATTFIPLVPSALGSVFSPGLSNLIFIEAAFNAQPWSGQDLSAGASLKTFLRPTAGPVDVSGFNTVTGSTSAYMGLEIDLYAVYGIFSDLAVSFNGGVYFPGAAIDADSPVQAAISLGATVKL